MILLSLSQTDVVRAEGEVNSTIVTIEEFAKLDHPFYLSTTLNLAVIHQLLTFMDLLRELVSIYNNVLFLLQIVCDVSYEVYEYDVLDY